MKRGKLSRPAKAYTWNFDAYRPRRADRDPRGAAQGGPGVVRARLPRHRRVLPAEDDRATAVAVADRVGAADAKGEGRLAPAARRWRLSVSRFRRQAVHGVRRAPTRLSHLLLPSDSRARSGPG